MLADDPIFGRFCFGGDWRKTSTGLEVIPKDGLRRRFHAMLKSGTLHAVLENDRFAAAEPIKLNEGLSELQFSLESDNPDAHSVNLNLLGLRPASTLSTSVVSGLRQSSWKETERQQPHCRQVGVAPLRVQIARQAELGTTQ